MRYNGTRKNTEEEYPLSILSQLLDETTRLQALIALLYRLPAVLIALTLHELAHGYVALRCGDPTAQMLGRLSFNPLKHLDPIGTVCMFLLGVGWAKPVPVNPRNFKNYRRDDLLVSLAGVVVNFLLFVFATLLMLLMTEFLYKPEMWDLGGLTTRRDFLRFDGYNFRLAYTNESLIAVAKAKPGYIFTAELAGYLKTPWLQYVQRFLMDFSMVNIGLALFNLLPIPPLDGYHVFNDILFRGRLHIPARVMNFLSFALLVLIFATDVVSDLMGNAIFFVQGGLVDGLLKLFGVG